MFIELVESNMKPKFFSGGAVVSVALHTALICVAISATANARTEREHPITGTKVIYFPPRQAVTPVPAVGKQPSRPAIPTAEPSPPAPVVTPIAVATGIPEITQPSSPPEISTGPASPGGGGASIEQPAGTSQVGAHLTELQVDKPVRAFRTNRAPVYPDVLRTRGVEGEVLARFVVSESGRVDMNSVELRGTSSSAFEDAVRYALERARFAPAEAAGKRVAQLVEQRFQFKLN